MAKTFLHQHLEELYLELENDTLQVNGAICDAALATARACES